MEPKEETRVERINRLKREALDDIEFVDAGLLPVEMITTGADGSVDHEDFYAVLTTQAAALVAIAKLLYVLTSQDTGAE